MARGAFLSVALVLLIGLSLGSVPALAMADSDEPLDPDADRVHIDVRVDANGDAVWQVSYRIDLETDADRAAFDELAAEIENEPDPYVDRYTERMTTSAVTAEEATGREMAIEDMTVRTDVDELPTPTGIIRYEFRWTNFADADDDSVTAGDALDGLYLDDDSSLVIGGPDGWTVTSVAPDATDERVDAVVWRGPYEFGEGEPRVTIAPEEESTVTSATLGLLLTAMIVLVIVGVGGWYRYGSRGGGGESPFDTAEADDGGLDPELMSNEEQVMTVLAQHGGRMKQKELADHLGWTAAKTSQLTTDLREEGRIEGFRLGRENVLKLPDDDE